MTLVDRRLSSEIILALSRYKTRVFNSKYADKKIAEKYSRYAINNMVSAEKFHISNDLLRLIVKQSFGDQESCLEAMVCGMPPYPKMWIEWDEDCRLNCEREFWEQEPFNGKYPKQEELLKNYKTKKFGRQGCLITNISQSIDPHPDLAKSGRYYWFDTLGFVDNELLINPFSPMVEFDFREERNFISEETKEVYNNIGSWHGRDKVHNSEVRLKANLRSLGISWVDWMAKHHEDKAKYFVPMLDRIYTVQHSMSPIICQPSFFNGFNGNGDGLVNRERADDIVSFFKQNEGDLRFLFHALACLNSTEVQREYVQSKPNKKYTRFGVRVPCSEYKTLKLLVPKTKKIFYDSGSTGNGSPKRFHKRRGHWRNLKSGKMVWVKHCSVGNEELGSVHHEYDLATQ